MLTHPATAYRTCSECKRWIYDIQTGQRKHDKITGEPISRPPNTKMPCGHCPRCEGEPVKSREVGQRNEWSARNWRTWELFWRQRVAGGVVWDAVMRRNFGIIAEVLAQYDRAVGKAGIRVT